MAGLLPGDPSHHGMVEGGSYSFAQDKPEESGPEGGRWYLSRKEIEENSPSRKDGVDLKKEAYLRKSYCTFLQDLGMRLKVPQVTIATAIIFCHRFFLRQSHVKNDRRTIATVCMFLAGKVEETPRPLKDVILVSNEIIHKKDPAAAQRIKQKESYEQQKELILIGERVVLATLGFDFNVYHPYKPLVEAIKKFKVAQNALAQVAWNFVNDGLRTSLCLQFKPHHIAAGAILLAAKFLKVKLPSDGEKIWWQEFDVTPRQLEEVSNQMLELYEQNRIPPTQGSEVEGSVDGGACNRALTKTPIAHEESASVNGYVQGGAASTVKSGSSIPSSSRPPSDQSYVDNEENPRKSSQNPSNDHTSSEMRNIVSDHKVDDESKDNRDILGEARNRSRYLEDQERNNGRNEAKEAGERKNEESQHKSNSTGARNIHREGPLGQSPQDAIKKIDKDKFKAALEKRRKSKESRGDKAPKTDLTDEDDLIERELEDGVELAVEDDKIKRGRGQSWSKSSNKQEHEVSHGKDLDKIGDETEAENVEEGELSLVDEGNQEYHSPKTNSRKRKFGSPNKHHLEGKQRHDYTSSHNHNDSSIDGNRSGWHGNMERDHKRHSKENYM